MRPGIPLRAHRIFEHNSGRIVRSGDCGKEGRSNKEDEWTQLSALGIPYYATCYERVTTKGIFKKAKENPGVDILHTSPPTYACRNEEYLAKFMEANRTR